MSISRKHVVFDVVGTCVSYDVLFNAIDHRLGDKLRADGMKPNLLGYLWIEVTEREYTYLSMNGRYVGFRAIFSKLFYRILHMAGIQNPYSLATDDDLNYILQQYMKLEVRPGIKECFKILRDNGFAVWALTAGDIERVGGYLTHSGIDMPLENVISCDRFGIGKPDPRIYRMVLDRLDDGETWFVAAHNWDVTAAKQAGFKGAYCTVWEKILCEDIFGKMDVTAETFPDLARQIVAASKSAPKHCYHGDMPPLF